MGNLRLSPPPKIILTIAGSDSSGGAGIQADARAIHALGGFAATAITALTAQNTRGITTWSPTPEPLLRAQITAVLSDLPVAAIKTGLLPGPAAIQTIAKVLSSHPAIPLVIDPVIGSTTGTRFLDASGLHALLTNLLPLATIVTPNWPEAAALTGRQVRNPTEAATAARHLTSYGCAVLVKGGHSTTDRCDDVLVTPDGQLTWFRGKRIQTTNTHGTGCTLSAAIATGLAHGHPLVIAIKSARAHLRQNLLAHRHDHWSDAGRGPAAY